MNSNAVVLGQDAPGSPTFPNRNYSNHQASAGVRAIEYVRRMRGGSQPQLMRCSDDKYYVVKVQNNPQGIKILFNDLFGSRLAALLGLPAAPGEIVFVDQRLIDLSPEMMIELGRGRDPCRAGYCFGSRFPVDPRRFKVFELLPLEGIKNRIDFFGMLVFDKWTCNTDHRQVVFFREDKSSPLTAVMIDHGFCFNSTAWNFPDSPLRGAYCRAEIYESVSSIDSFEPWLSRLETQIDAHSILAAANGIPEEWYEANEFALERLLEQLNRRRSRVRELLWSSLKYTHMFPNWIAASAATAR